MKVEATKAIRRRHIFNSGYRSKRKPNIAWVKRLFSIITAGIETVARALAIAPYYLLSKPDVLESLRIELKEMQPDPQLDMDIRVLGN